MVLRRCLWQVSMILVLGSLSLADDTEIPLPFGALEQGLSSHWQPQHFRGIEPTEYRLVEQQGAVVLEAGSRNQASGLIHEIDLDLARYPILVWRWKVAGVIPGGNALTREGDDYAARIYVVFPHWFRPKTKSINYIWANQLPRGEVVPNPFFSNARMVAVQSGSENVGGWITQCRNVYQDYVEIFGAAPPEAGAIALMTDTDNTGGQARAWYGDLRLIAAAKDADPALFCP